MAMASYFFVGSPQEAQLNDGLEGGPRDRRVEFYRVHDIALKPLYEKIEGKECPKFEPAAMSDDYAQITFMFPKPFIDALAKVKEENDIALIQAWKESSEVPYDNDQDLQDLLKALCRLSRLALERDENLYMWNCA